MKSILKIEHRGAGNTQRPPQIAKWLWDGMIREGGPSMLAGYGESGKGILAMMLALSTAAGRTLYDRKVNGGLPGTVLFISAEDDEEELAARMYDLTEAMSIPKSALLNIELRSTIDMQVAPSLFDKQIHPTGLLSAIKDYCQAHKPALIVLDTLAAFAPAGVEMQAGSAAATQYITATTAMLHPATILWPSHLRKPSTGKGKEGETAARPTIFDVRDSSALVNSMRSVLILANQQLSLDKCNGRRRCEKPITADTLFTLRWEAAEGCSNGMLNLISAVPMQGGNAIVPLKDRGKKIPIPQQGVNDDDNW